MTRRAHALAYLEQKGHRLTEPQREAVTHHLLLELVDRLSIRDTEEAIDAAVKLVTRRHPTPPPRGTR